MDFQVDPSWSSTLRLAALSLILLRAGLAMDLGALKRLRYVVPSWDPQTALDRPKVRNGTLLVLSFILYHT